MLSRASQDADKRVRDIENTSQARVQQVREKSSQDMLLAKQKYNEDMTQLNEFGEQRLASQRDLNDRALQSEVERGRSTQDRLRARNEKEFTEVKERGDRQIASEKNLQETKLKRLNEASTQSYEKNQQQWEAKEENLNKVYAERLLHEKKANEDQLRTQNNHFQSAYQKNALAHQEAFNIQKQNLNKELAETRKDFARAAEKYYNKADDPFYKVEDRGSYMRENPDFYILRAFVPEHEKDNVKVSIQNDRATVSGQRSFKDKMEDENNGKTVSSSSFQTFREEFAFDKPVITEGMTRERQGDWMVFHIPKGIPRLNRKA